MNAFDEFNPLSVFVYFLAAAGIAMFASDPVLLSLSMLGSVLLYCIRTRSSQRGTHLFSLMLFIGLSLINPLFQHNGVTVLFVLNDNPVTLEALLYGISAAAMIVSVLYWFRSFSAIITSDKLLYLFGLVSSKLALLVSMALRYVPLFKAQAKNVDAAQRAMGQYREDNVIDAIRLKLSVFSIMVSWALENGIVTADSMAARGYGAGRRSFYAIYHMRKADVAAIIVSLALMCALIALRRYAAFAFYPALDTIGINAGSLALYGLYALLAFAPTLVELGEGLKWHCLRSRI